jgi:predicted glycosyltransferase
MKHIQKGLKDNGHHMNLQHIEGKLSHEEMQRRMVGQMEIITDYSPDVLLLEGFPFMRYAWYEKHNSIKEVLKLAKSMGTQVITSVRDIAIQQNDKRSAFAVEMLNEYVDLVLVHGDKSFIELEDTFPHTNLIDVPIHYTGYVTDLYKPSSRPSRHGVVVSGASGAVGDLVFDEAIKLCKRSTYKEPWTFIISDKHPTKNAKKFIEYSKDKKNNIKVVSNITSRQFRKLLTKSRLSISQCGYNTFLDSIITETPTTFVPYCESKSSDQPMRSERYGNGNINIDVNGVKNTVEILETFVHNEDMNEMAKCC